MKKAINKIPYTSTDIGTGMILSGGIYSAAYEIENIICKNLQVFMQELYRFFNRFSDEITYQFVCQSITTDKNEYIGDLKITSADYQDLAETYNDVIIDNAEIGCNNTQKKILFILGTKSTGYQSADSKIGEIINALTNEITIFNLRKLTLYERLELIHAAFNPDMEHFGEILDINNTGDRNLENLKPLKMIDKELVAPIGFIDSETRYDRYDNNIINQNTEYEYYTRSFFMNGIPSELSFDIISDISNTCSHMLYSVFYNPVAAELGFRESDAAVRKNTKITTKPKRDTLADRKNKTVTETKERIKHDENEYFYESATELTKQAVAGESVFADVSVIITLYGKTMDELDRNMSLLKISAQKFACSVKILTMQQYRGFVSSLPLCDLRVNVSRFLDYKRIAKLCPVPAGITKQRGMFNGLNIINDNLVMIDRKISNNIGMITGAEHSGKTYQMKREIINSLLGTDDVINIITCTDDYDNFITAINGTNAKIPEMNLFEMNQGYGLTDDAKLTKTDFINAIAASGENIMQADIDFTDNQQILQYLAANQSEFTELNKIIASQMMDNDFYGLSNKSRVNLYRVKNKTEMLIVLDYLWNRTLECRKNNQTVSLFIDNIDSLLKKQECTTYMCRIFQMMKKIGSSITVTIQSVIDFCNDDDVKRKKNISTFVYACEYIKLLNTSPTERKYFAETINISPVLLQYITHVIPGRGLIITQMSDIAFDDNFLGLDSKFTRFFTDEKIE